jgi:hypothetical protein
MDTFSTLTFLRIHFSRRIYWLFLAVGGLCLIERAALSQELNAYKTVASGNFPDISIWETWDGFAWIPALAKPGQGNDIYIDRTHTLRLTGDEAVKSVYINAEVDAYEKLNLNGFNLDIYGGLAAFSGAAPGIPGNAWGSQNWIGNSLTSSLTFKGTTRVLIHKDSWSGQTRQSRFAVIFAADAGETLVLEAPLKSLSFIVRSGTVHQKLDTSVIPNACSTLSFNNETTVFGEGPFGSFVIEPGATLLSECNSNIINRSTSGTISAHNFTLHAGGRLILEGASPRIEAATFQLDGKLIFRGGSSVKNFLTSSYTDATLPREVRDVEIQGTYDLTLPSQLTIRGNLVKSGDGDINASNTSLTLVGSEDQEILGFPLNVRDLTLDKPAGSFFPHSNLSIHRNFTLLRGSMDLEGNELSFNTSLSGTYAYSSGSWRNVGQLNYFGIPSALTSSNATFPYEDTQNGGLRKVQLLGATAGGNLSITFTEYEGAEYNSGFKDTDETEILYRLFSYFQFSNLTNSATPLELRISAHQLIVDDVDDLRIVSTGYAAPGSHLPGQDSEELWARRQLTFSDLEETNFTIGSYRTLSVLPVTWLEISTEETDGGSLIQWMVAYEEADTYYEIYRNSDPLVEQWENVGTIYPSEYRDGLITYQFLDSSPLPKGYYQVRQIASSGTDSWSDIVMALHTNGWIKEVFLIYPNPYHSGSLTLSFPRDINVHEAWMIIHDAQGKVFYHDRYTNTDPSRIFGNLLPGLFHVKIIINSRVLSGKLIRK